MASRLCHPLLHRSVKLGGLPGSGDRATRFTGSFASANGDFSGGRRLGLGGRKLRVGSPLGPPTRALGTEAYGRKATRPHGEVVHREEIRLAIVEQDVCPNLSIGSRLSGCLRAPL